jgi:predicted transglutaminase-like cysteine proteinase
MPGILLASCILKAITMEQEEITEISKEFKKLVNMSASKLEKWLQTEESKSVGWDSGDGESIGHKSGEKIIKILEKKADDLTPQDYKHMQKVNGYINRHLAQKPKGDLGDTNWHYSLKNWGHDYHNK